MQHEIDTFKLSGKVVLYAMIVLMVLNVLITAVLFGFESLSYDIQDFITRIILVSLILLLIIFIVQIVRLALFYSKYTKYDETLRIKGTVISILVIPLYALVSFFSMIILALRTFS